MATNGDKTGGPASNDGRPNSGMREGGVSHAEVNAVLRAAGKTVIFGQQNRLRAGLYNWRFQAAVAAQANLPVWQGSGLDLGIATAAQLHLSASAPNCTLPGAQAGPWLRESHLLTRDLRVESGHILLPAGPGLGVEIDRNALDKYTTFARTWT